MPRFQVTNAAKNSLRYAITATQPTITLNDSFLFPASAPPGYPLLVYYTDAGGVQHQEHMLAYGKQGDVLSVVRASEDAARFPAIAFPAMATVEINLSALMVSTFLTRRTLPVLVQIRAHEPVLTNLGQTVMAAQSGRSVLVEVRLAPTTEAVLCRLQNGSSEPVYMET